MSRFSEIFVSKDRAYFDLFEAAATNMAHAAEMLSTMLADYPDKKHLVDDIRATESAGDSITHDLINRLNNTFVTPIDREDILELASAFDDVIDYTEETADYLGLYGIEAPMEQSQRLARILLDATRQLQLAVPSVRDFSDASEPIREVHRLENDGDRVSRDAIASLFQGGIDPMVVIRWKDIFSRLEHAIDACEHVADVIDEIIIKNA